MPRCAEARAGSENELAKSGTAEPITLNVGITGHRAAVLTAPLLQALTPVVDEVFTQLHAATLRIQETEVTFCSDTPASLRLHTALASGADQIAAVSARSSGYSVRALLPFDPDEYRKDFAAGAELAEFDRAMEAADELVALPGDRSVADEAYVLVGKSLVEAADVLVAIWDGEQGRGPGGTAHVVDLALQNAVPVVHIGIDRETDHVQMRALIGGDARAPIHTPLNDTNAYCALLRGAFRLGPVSA